MPKKVDLDGNLDVKETHELTAEEQEILKEVKERLANPIRRERREI